METKRNDWKVLQLFTAVIVAAIVKSALSSPSLVQAATTSELTIEERLAAVRAYLKQRGEIITDPSHPLSSSQENPKTEDSDIVFSVKPSPRWSKWSKWFK